MPFKDRLKRFIAVFAVFAVFIFPDSASAEVWHSDDAIGYIVHGTGYGHGRGMSQYGAYGWAVDYGWTWEEILDFYYGGTVLADVENSDIRVRLTAWDNTEDVTLVSTSGPLTVTFAGENVLVGNSVQLIRTGTNQFTIQSSPNSTCGDSSFLLPSGPFSQNSARQIAVKSVQSFLANRGFQPGPVDGIFGPMTAGAVARFQASVGLPDNGTWSSEEAFKGSLQMLDITDASLQTGSTLNVEVRKLQRFLNDQGFNAGPVDGIFGSMTRGALVRFQVAAEIPTTGVWGRDDAAAAISYTSGEDAQAVAWGDVRTGISGPIVVSVDQDESSGDAGDALAVCSGQQLTHYRGTIEFLQSNAGSRLVNEVSVDNYLRGVVPKEVSASWGDAGGGAGMNALMAQSVAARSYVLAESRYSYADTCDTQSCQVYGGAAKRSSSSAPAILVERPQTDSAISQTSGKVRTWSTGANAGQIASTEYSSSNGPNTAGGAFPSVEDLGDATSRNPNHTWSRVITLEEISAKYPSADLDGISTEENPVSAYEGIYANRVRLNSNLYVSALAFRAAFGLLSPGFVLEKITVANRSDLKMAQVGDSVGVGATSRGLGGAFDALSSQLFLDPSFDNLTSRAVGLSPNEKNGLGALEAIPEGTDLVVIELGYNGGLTARSIDAAMNILEAKGAPAVAWVNLSTRSGSYAQSNTNLSEASARWSNLTILDWSNASSGASSDRWFASDGLHLTKTGNAEFSTWLVSQLSDVLDEIFKDPDIDDCSTSSQCEDPVLTTTVDVPDGPIGFKSNDTDSVRKIQRFLAEYNFRPGPIDGDFGRMTLAALNRFQRQSSLAITNQWSPTDALKARELGSVVPETPPSNSTMFPAGPLSVGSADSVSTRSVQRYLSYAGHNPGPVDGIYGRMTAGAVRRFQASKGLTQSGVWGSAEQSAASADLATPAGPLSVGSADSVSTRSVQRYLSYAGHNPGPVDGIYGRMTAGAVRRFQASKGLTQSGVWGSAEQSAAN